MKDCTKMLGPKNEEEALIFAQEGLRVDFQVALHELMLEQGITKEELWEKLNDTSIMAIGLSNVDALFSDESDLTLHDIAAVLHVLGRRLKITFESES